MSAGVTPINVLQGQTAESRREAEAWRTVARQLSSMKVPSQLHRWELCEGRFCTLSPASLLKTYILYTFFICVAALLKIHLQVGQHFGQEPPRAQSGLFRSFSGAGELGLCYLPCSYSLDQNPSGFWPLVMSWREERIGHEICACNWKSGFFFLTQSLILSWKLL